MSVRLEDYREELLRAAPALADTLDATVHEAARALSPAGLRDYLEGARALVALGRGPQPLLAYLEAMPSVARECGETVVRDGVHAALKLASMTSGEVLALAFTSLPTAALRLADAELLGSYLQFLHRLASTAPRGLRPMLEHLDELLGKLTLSGLRRWAEFGAEAYRRDLPRQAAYFALQTEDSKAVLQKERHGTLFVDAQRRLNFYLRAFWGRDFYLRPAAADHAGFRPYLAAQALHLPDAVDDVGGVAGIELYRAMCAHLAAHLVHTREPQVPESLAPAQQFVIGLLEDARIEYCAAQAFPGLRRLWLSVMRAAQSGGAAPHAGVALLEQCAVALLDPAAPVGDTAAQAIVQRFHASIAANRQAGALSRQLGLELFALLAERRAVPSLRILEGLRIPYRDDNRFVWSQDAFDWSAGEAYLPASLRQVRRRVSLMEFVNEVEVETAGDDAQEVWVLDGVLYDDDGVTYNEREGREPVSDPFHYAEWDYRVQLHRPNWTAVYERRQRRGDGAVVEHALSAHRGVSHRIRGIVDRLRPQGLLRQRKLEDGDELDLGAAVDAAVALRMGLPPDARIGERRVLRRRDLAVLILLDLSESTNEKVRGAERTVLELTRDASALLAAAVDGIGDPFAIHGFASDGRHDVRYFRFKDFGERFDATVKDRLAGMHGGLSTRMGAAMRHAGRHLLARGERRKLLLVLTDGEPADVDERDPQYLRLDAKKAAEELHARGVLAYCLTLDPQADRYVERIFGAGRYTIVDRVTRLPEQLPALFASLTR